MNYYFITGTGRGIGRALAEHLLQNENNFVYGLSRSNEISHENFHHIQIDLNKVNEVKNYEFPEVKNSESIILINNAASSGEVKHLGKRDQDLIISDYNVNIISPSLIMNSFLKSYQNENCKRVILNVSSGAGKRAIESWSIYCSSKSALEMISEVTALEQKLKHSDNPVHIFAVGPGVVDTKMQDELRKVNPDDFSMVGQFIEFKEKGELADPKDIAIKLTQIIADPDKFDKVSFSVKDF